MLASPALLVTTAHLERMEHLVKTEGPAQQVRESEQVRLSAVYTTFNPNSGAKGPQGGIGPVGPAGYPGKDGAPGKQKTKCLILFLSEGARCLTVCLMLFSCRIPWT